MNRRAAYLFLLGVSLLGESPGWAQRRPVGGETTPRMFSIRGTLRLGANERGADMVKVELRRFTGETVATIFTRTNGEFEFSGLTSGSYILAVEEHDFEPIREFVEIHNTSRAGIQLYLNKRLTPAVGEPGSVVSARELALPRKARSAYQKGMERLYDKKDLEGSLVHFRRALEELPGYYEAYHQMGVAYLDLGRYEEAEQAFRKAIELSEYRFADPHFALSSILSTTQKFAEAEGVVRRGLSLSPNAWQGHYELGRVLLGMNRADDAEKSAQEARTLKADFPPLYLLMANIHIRKKNHVALLDDLDEYLKLDPNGPASANARQMRDTVRGALEQAQKTPPPTPSKP